MQGIINQLHATTSTVFSGTIKSILEERFILLDENGKVVRAEKAVSCLITPKSGDRVLVGDTGDTAYVLAVLKRPTASESTIELDGDVRMTVPNGKIEIDAKEGISISTPNDLDFVAGRLGLSGESLAAAFRKLDLFGDVVHSHFTDVKMFAKQLQTKVDSAVQQFTMRHATVDALDSVEAGTIKQTAKNIMSLKSIFSFIKAEKNVKIDGKQIFLA